MASRVMTALGLLVFAHSAFAVVDELNREQSKYEREIGAVVRNKSHYRAGKVELGFSAGILPYDLSVNYLTYGGRLTWHISDHYGWEIADVQMASGSVTSFVTGLASDPNKLISNLQIAKTSTFATSNFLVSPFYGKIRFFGSQVLYFDIYIPVGFGFSEVETLRYQYSAGSAVATSIAKEWNPTLTVGLGLKLYLNGLMGISIDLRDYITNTQIYSARSLRSNFVVTGGLTFFIPPF